MKIFISQPMRGFPREEIEAERKRIKDMFHGNEFVENYRPDKECPFECKTPELYSLGLAISMMCWADLVILPTSTWEYPGCRVEAEVADAYGIPVVRIPMYTSHINRYANMAGGGLTCEAK